MIFTETELKGAFILEVERIVDERGFFGRTFCQKEFEKHGLETGIAQANMSFNKKKGTVRGMHYQVAPYQETKLVKCTSGAIYDIIIDLREDSSTYGKWIGVELSGENNRMLYVPKDFAHGFITLEDNTSIQYLVSQFYTPGSERGIKWDDPKFDLKWPIEVSVISEKDNSHPYFTS
ncbi:dTDP-4-dehydrorhamnose 3,5-epimerase [Cyclobacterium plantarum]|uniref:dTDP-4-dehydrorhamnose 3,5-epimerase n=1 Tax=Cyclobacterium plantarum TaxID=2716263 RepID=UPI003F70B1CD